MGNCYMYAEREHWKVHAKQLMFTCMHIAVTWRTCHDFHVVIGRSPSFQLLYQVLNVTETMSSSKLQYRLPIHLEKCTQPPHSYVHLKLPSSCIHYLQCDFFEIFVTKGCIGNVMNSLSKQLQREYQYHSIVTIMILEAYTFAHSHFCWRAQLVDMMKLPHTCV